MCDGVPSVSVVMSDEQLRRQNAVKLVTVRVSGGCLSIINRTRAECDTAINPIFPSVAYPSNRPALHLASSPP